MVLPMVHGTNIYFYLSFFFLRTFGDRVCKKNDFKKQKTKVFQNLGKNGPDGPEQLSRRIDPVCF
jgi:hypothetical protein